MEILNRLKADNFRAVCIVKQPSLPRNRHAIQRGDSGPDVNAFYDSIAERALQAGRNEEAGLAKDLETLFKDGKRVQRMIERILSNERVLESELRAAHILMRISKPRLEQELALAKNDEERAVVRARYEQNYSCR